MNSNALLSRCRPLSANDDEKDDDSLLARLIKPIDLEAHLDEAHRAVLETLPALDYNDLEPIREGFNAFIASLPPIPDTVSCQEVSVPSFDGHEILLRVFRPVGVSGSLPVLYWMYGGGLVSGSAAVDNLNNARFASELGIVVVSVEYRLAPENPYPTPILDCYCGLLAVAARTEEFGIDPTRIAVGGASSGAGLAAALALLVRDEGGPALCFQFLVYPQLDDRNRTFSSYSITDMRVWQREANVLSWHRYLPNGLAGSRKVPIYAAAGRARVRQLRNLPRAFIQVGRFDLFLDEDIDYGQRLMKARVPTDMIVYEGAFHASNALVPNSEISQRWLRDADDALRRGLKLV